MSNITILFDRDSICMGDDVNSHQKEMVIDSNILLSDLLKLLIKSVPSMNNIVWSVTSNKGLIGYIITDDNGNPSVEVNGEDKTVGSCNIEKVFCFHFYESNFSWTDGATGEKVVKYPECHSLLEKVKKSLEKKK